MDTDKEHIKKLIEDIPESKIKEVLDFLLLLKNRQDQERNPDEQKEAELWNLIKTDVRVSSEKVHETFKGE